MFYKNSPLALSDQQQHFTSIGCTALKMRRISTHKRTSWPPNILENTSHNHPSLDVQIADPSDMENVLVFVHPSSLEDPSYSPPRTPSLKDGRQTFSNRPSRSRVPSIRTPPPDLWNIAPSKTSKGSTASTSSSEIGPSSPSYSVWTQQSHPNHRPTSLREPLRPIGQVQAPIGSERHRWTSPPGGACNFTPGGSQVPSVPPGCKKAVSPPKTFIDALLENKRKNPHAPSMVSMFNPLRDQIPFRAWACIPHSARQARGSDTLALPSARFRTSLYAIPDRRRRECEWATSALWKGKAYWLNKTRNHCWDCKHETLHVKLLAFHYHVQRSRYPSRLPSPDNPPPFGEDGDDDDDDDSDDDFEDAMEIEVHDTASSENLLDSPTLRDFDDFDDFVDGDDSALLRNHDDVEMADRSLF